MISKKVVLSLLISAVLSADQILLDNKIIEIPFTSILNMPIEHMTFRTKRANEEMSALDSKLALIQDNGVINLQDWFGKLSPILEPTLGGKYTTPDGEWELFYLLPYPVGIAPFSMPVNEKGFVLKSGTLTTYSAERGATPYCTEKFTEDRSRNRTACYSTLGGTTLGLEVIIPNTEITYRYEGFVEGSMILKDGHLTINASAKDGKHFELTTSPRHLLYSTKGSVDSEFSDTFIKEKFDSVMVSMTQNNYQIIWDNNDIFVSNRKIMAIKDGMIQYGEKEPKKFNQYNSSEYYCTALDIAKQLQKEKGLSQSEIVLRFIELMPTDNENFKKCQIKPQIGDVMYDKNANIVFGHKMKFKVTPDDVVSNAYSNLLQDEKTANFVESVDRAVRNLENRSKLIESNAMKSLAIKAIKSKNYEKIHEAVFSAKTVDAMFIALKIDR